MSINKFEQSLKSGAHQKMKSLIGKWKGTSKSWFEKDVSADESSLEA